MKMRNLFPGAFLALTLLAAETSVVQSRKLISEKKFDEAIAVLEKSRAAKPSSREIQMALADAHMQAGDSFMYNASLPPFRKYPTALRHYRSAVKLNPKNAKAKENIATIEGIYKQMGRPVPQ